MGWMVWRGLERERLWSNGERGGGIIWMDGRGLVFGEVLGTL